MRGFTRVLLYLIRVETPHPLCGHAYQFPSVEQAEIRLAEMYGAAGQPKVSSHEEFELGVARTPISPLVDQVPTKERLEAVRRERSSGVSTILDGCNSDEERLSGESMRGRDSVQFLDVT